MQLDQLSALSLLGAFPEPTLVISAEGIIQFGNASARELLGVDSLATGEAITAYLPEQERSRLQPLTWLKRWADQPRAPELRHVHLICRTRDGSSKPVRVRVGRLDTTPPCYVVMLQDISDEQARQQQTRQAHRLAARVLAISADGVLNVDANGIILYANPSAEALFGYASGQLAGSPLTDLLPQRHRAAHAGFMQRFAREPAPARLMGERAEITGLTRNGEEIPLEASIAKITTDQGLVFNAQLRDLRARKAEAAALARSQASLRTVFEHALQAMALIAPDGTVLEMNAAARQLLPPGAQPQGARFAELPFWSEDPAATATRLGEAIARCLAGELYRARASVRLPDGSERSLDFSLSPVHEGAEVFAIIAEARDLARAAS
ncbi:MAG: PAS domain S-box protein [Pseudomonadales bacterium]